MALIGKTHTAVGDTGDTGEFAEGRLHTHQCVWNCTGGGTVTGTVVHEGTNDPAGVVGWTNILTFTQTNAADGTIDKQVLEHTWLRVRSRCTALSGSGGTPSVRSIVSSR